MPATIRRCVQALAVALVAFAVIAVTAAAPASAEPLVRSVFG